MLSEKIYMLRRKNGLTQEQLAEKIGVSRQAISKWEGDLSTPELDKLIALSECFNISIDELTKEETAEAASEAAAEPSNESPGQNRSPNNLQAASRIGIILCIIGAVLLLCLSIMLIISPHSVEQINAASAITLNGYGILLLLSVSAMLLGAILALKKNKF